MVTTIILPVSRPDFLQQVFSNLELLECKKEETNLFVYVDGDQVLYEKARNYTVKSKFAERLCVFRAKGLPNVGSIRGRRQRIADIHNEIKGHLKSTGHLFLTEDDTIVPTNALTKLHDLASMDPYAGFISGVELGRWGYLHVGAWHVNDLYEPTQITSVAKSTELEKVDAAGLYCCLITEDVYKNHTFKPFQDVLGPDVDFGLTMRQRGRKNYVDHSIQCRHLTKRGSIIYSKEEVIQVQLTKENDKWSAVRVI